MCVYIYIFNLEFLRLETELTNQLVHKPSHCFADWYRPLHPCFRPGKLIWMGERGTVISHSGKGFSQKSTKLSRRGVSEQSVGRGKGTVMSNRRLNAREERPILAHFNQLIKHFSQPGKSCHIFLCYQIHYWRLINENPEERMNKMKQKLQSVWERFRCDIFF